jgi:hypothetical protein
MILEEVAKEQRETKNKFLTSIVRVCVGLGDVGVGRYHPVNGCHDHLEQRNKFRIIFRTDIEGCDFREAFQSDIAEVRGFQELSKGGWLAGGGKAIDRSLRVE